MKRAWLTDDWRLNVSFAEINSAIFMSLEKKISEELDIEDDYFQKRQWSTIKEEFLLNWYNAK